MTLAIFLAMISSSIILIVNNSALSLDPSYEGFNEFAMVFKVPISLCAFGAAVLALLATNHRSNQSALASRQHDDASRQRVIEMLASEAQRTLDSYDSILCNLYRFSNHTAMLSGQIHWKFINDPAKELRSYSSDLLKNTWSGFYSENRYMPAFARVVNNFLMGNKVAEHLNISTEKYRKLVISTINQ
ncbi:MAG: hypothetical protein HLX50_02170 [Alteromonadaceae bacterium]|nr:hypothetical protein [Alteromonadaceae bacterium]